LEVHISDEYWLMIPFEVLLYIFSFLGLKELLSVSITCKKWKLIAEDPQLLKKLAFQKWGDLVKDRQLTLSYLKQRQRRMICLIRNSF